MLELISDRRRSSKNLIRLIGAAETITLGKMLRLPVLCPTYLMEGRTGERLDLKRGH